MDGQQPRSIRLFDRQAEFYLLDQRHLPHWSQTGTLAFITWRTWDSIAQEVLDRWQAEDNDWVRRHGVDPRAANREEQLAQIHRRLPDRLRRFRSSRWHAHLDRLHGDCILRRPELHQVVAECLRHFDGQRYELTDFIVMPNHVHLLAAFPDEQAMVAQCYRWKRYTALRINQLVERRERFWQTDAFDHLVRTVEQFDFLRKYIADNPRRARLKAGEYAHFSKQL
jgi:type I restriction enzyme R subunit